MNALSTDIVYSNIERISIGKGVAVMEDPQTPGSDCNSNPATDAMSQDMINSDFIQDNVDYQWFIDYGYRDSAMHVHPSVLSSLSASYTRDDLGYYDDLARNLDANLAEIDMESFRTADIHTLLSALPVMCTNPTQDSELNYRRERYASISDSMMETFNIYSLISPRSNSQGDDSACSTTDTISICKSSLLFSPLKETPVLPPGGSYSVDSLDCEDMLLTCQTNNKNNYTIAFEGSIAMYSDGSQDFENQEKQKVYESTESYYSKKIDLKNILDLSMACSDSKIYTTWSNLKHSATNKVMTRHPSGNNNTISNFMQNSINILNSSKKSRSLPDLRKNNDLQQLPIPLNLSIDSGSHNNTQHSSSLMSRSITEESSESGDTTTTGKKLRNLNLVRLYMKQKSMSSERMSLTLDQFDSGSDGGWPTSNSSSNSDSGTNVNTQIQRQNTLNVNTCSRHLSGGNDFSINWVKNCEREHQKESDARRNSPLKEHQDEIPNSESVEEMSRSFPKPSSETSNLSEPKINHENLKELKNDAGYALFKNKRSMSKTTGSQATIETEENGVQTSLLYAIPVEKNCPSLHKTILNQRPIYIVYPNYTLPDLSFLNMKENKIDNVALKPHGFDKRNVGLKNKGKTGRPFSCNDIDALKQRGFSHVKDWESLTFLLPTKYKKILHDVPEIPKHININEEMKKPLFCLSPPMRHKVRTLSNVMSINTSTTSSIATQPSSGYRGSSTILTDSSTNQPPATTNSTNPLYLYRYDSMSSEASLVSTDKKTHWINPSKTSPSIPKRSISLPHGEKESECCSGKVPPRPPLPRSILRKNRVPTSKRYSMFEMGGVQEVEDKLAENNKRMSLQEPYHINNDLHIPYRGKIIDSEKDIDETEEKYYLEKNKNEMKNVDIEFSSHNEDEVNQLEEFLKRSEYSSQSSDNNEDSEVKLRSYVRKFLALKMNKEIGKDIDAIDVHKKTVSFATYQRKNSLDNTANNLDITKEQTKKNKQYFEETKEIDFDVISANIEEKKKMIASVDKAVEMLFKYWNSEPVNNWQNSTDKNECAQLCLSNLCPALYTIMSDGLKSCINSAFGPITNSVWQVVEASSQQGPLTKTLNELVQKINGEDVMTEGMLKFHAFIFGLLNLRALDAWFAYLCTRESILRKHYNNNSLFVASLANTNAREIVDGLLYILNPLAFCPFQIDLLYQYRQLHNSFGIINNYIINTVSFRNCKENSNDKNEIKIVTSSPSKGRPRSCISYSTSDEKTIDIMTKKRLSNPISVKAFHLIDRLASEDSEDYTDSLEHSPLNKARQQYINQTDNTKTDEDDRTSGGVKFRKLQKKWEQMISKDDTKQKVICEPTTPTRLASQVKSKIPRLLTSPVKQPLNNNTSIKSNKPSVNNVTNLKKPLIIPMSKSTNKKPVTDIRAKDVSTRRTSRVDQEIVGTPRSHLSRPSSLPYKSYGVISREKNLTSPQRRAASTSLPRTAAIITHKSTLPKNKPKEVRTLTHYAPSDNGHLAFAEGERLKIILEVDSKWLLCARGDRKGLVPRTYVHALQT